MQGVFLRRISSKGWNIRLVKLHPKPRFLDEELLSCFPMNFGIRDNLFWGRTHRKLYA